MVYATALEAKVAAQNAVHKMALDHWPKLLEAVEPFVLEKVQNVGGELSKRVQTALPKLPSMCYYSTGAGYRLCAHFRVCFSSKRAGYDAAHYAEVSIPLGELQNGVLVRLTPTYELRTDYDVAKVQAARQRVKEIEGQLSKAKHELYHFGEYDR